MVPPIVWETFNTVIFPWPRHFLSGGTHTERSSPKAVSKLTHIHILTPISNLERIELPSTELVTAWKGFL